MLRSFCIKTNNQKIIDYMLYGFENANLANLYISNRKFKNYKNIILHFNGNDKASFYALIAGAITDVILNFYENTLIRYSLISNYFYFNLMDYFSENSRILSSLTFIPFLKNVFYLR